MKPRNAGTVHEEMYSILWATQYKLQFNSFCGKWCTIHIVNGAIKGHATKAVFLKNDDDAFITVPLEHILPGAGNIAFNWAAKSQMLHFTFERYILKCFTL